MPDDVADERTVVKTYVPRYQKQLWLEEADQLDMTQSEFLRTMVQAGRRDLLDGSTSPEEPSDREETRPPDLNPGGSDLETRLLDVLSSDEYRTWDELVELVIQDFEEELEGVLNFLRDDGTVEHSPRQDGYILTDGESNGEH